jgi:competence protein CoiA
LSNKHVDAFDGARPSTHLENVMQIALVNGERRKAAPELTGQCPGRAQTVNAKCGPRRIWHWAHLGKRTCDAWWEPETPWHSAWKGYFAEGFREVIDHDRNGERHVADVKTSLGLVLEFQHSRLDPQERAAREAFHGNMVWIVDGTRLKGDWRRFCNGKGTFRQTAFPGVFITSFPDECFAPEWLRCSVPVFFDFAGEGSEAGPEPDRRLLWCLLPGRVDGYAVVLAVSRHAFVKRAADQIQVVNAMARLRVVALELQYLRDVERKREIAKHGPRRRTSWYWPKSTSLKKPSRLRRWRY